MFSKPFKSYLFFNKKNKLVSIFKDTKFISYGIQSFMTFKIYLLFITKTSFEKKNRKKIELFKFLWYLKTIATDSYIPASVSKSL